jgi:probable HAF family extracellular repeat protein
MARSFHPARRTLVAVALLVASFGTGAGTLQSLAGGRASLAAQEGSASKEITPLDVLPGASFSQAAAINDGDVVAGTSGAVALDGGLLWQYAVRWVDDGTAVEDLGTLPGGRFSDGADINADGQIVGNSDTGDGDIHAFLWDHGGMTDLGTLGGTTSNARAINASGQIVGVSTNADGEEQAFLWDDGAMTGLATLGGASGAYDINDAGQIAGYAVGENGRETAVIWEDGEIVDLGVTGYAVGVNATGVVTGVFQGEDRRPHPFLWVDGTLTELDVLQNTSATPLRINDGGVVVGLSCPANGCQADTTDEWRATFWQGGQVADLGDVLSDEGREQWILQGAYDINNQGHVAGSGIFGADKPAGGQSRGFILWAGAAGIEPLAAGAPATTRLVARRDRAFQTDEAAICDPADPRWSEVNRWNDEVLAAQQQVNRSSCRPTSSRR